MSNDIALNEIMGFSMIVFSDGNGDVFRVGGESGPEMVETFIDSNGEKNDPEIPGNGDWELLAGYTGQYGYNGPVMHDSELIGGGLETYIRKNRGYYVALIHQYFVETDDPDNDYDFSVEDEGWCVAFKEADDSDEKIREYEQNMHGYYVR